MIALSWRLLARELRSGELRLLFAALAVAVAAVTAVGFFADRVHQALEREAQQLMGGDLVLIGDHSLPAQYFDEARQRGLSLAETLVFPSMVVAGEQAQLADIKAVSTSYPLRGRLSTSMRLGEAGVPAAGGPQPGTVWLDERLATALQVEPDEYVTVGRQRFRIGAILTLEPDRGINFFSLAPRLMMHLDDIPATGLVQFGSRLRYRLLLAGDGKAVGRYKDWLKGRLALGERLEDAENARPEVRNALDRAQRFLGLATLLTVVLSAVSVALAARRYMQRHLDACAVMRCLGLTQGGLLRLHGLLFWWLALISAIVGCLSGFAAHFVLIAWLTELLAISLPLPGWMPLWQGGAVAGVLLFGFALPPLLQLAKVPTLRVLRRELGPPRPFLLGGYLLGFVLLATLILFVAGDAKLGGLAIAGFTAALGSFWLLARLAVGGIASLRAASGFGWRQGLANLGRHATSATLQIVALAVGLMAMLLLTVTRGDLFEAWRLAMPVDAPNRFVINIQPEQRPAVSEMLAAVGVEAELAPMVRARLLRIGDQAISPDSFPDDERAQRLVAREFNLSWRSALPPGNRVVAGSWFAPGEVGQALASVEEGLAQTLGIKLGDELLFSVAGVEKTVRVSSLRKLEWDSMRVNFFVLTPPGVIEDVPATYITSFHVPPQGGAIGRQLVGRFPNLTVIDISAVIEQFRAVMAQVTRAVQFIFLFTLAAGAIVLYSALLTAFDERRYEIAVMRALGALRVQLRQAMLVELAIVGSVAGTIAAFGAMLLGQVIAHQVFQIDMQADYWLPPLAALGGALISTGIGWWAMRRLLQTPPLAALRTAG